MSEKINNIAELREHALRTLERLETGEIDISEAGVTGKLYENVISSLKTELQYAAMVGAQPQIPFIDRGREILHIDASTGEVMPQLEHVHQG